MTELRISRAAQLLGVSDDTLRRWIDAGKLDSYPDAAGRAVVDGAALARFLSDEATEHDDPVDRASSARNRFVGIVTGVLSDPVMSQVEMQCGPHRVVSLMSTEAVRELGLEIGSLATASVKATTVIVETPSDTEG
ncbi:helix-turn-helix transcriptional regulator [Gordonia sp. HY002]|uniref:TOBE domain-containing protein n=1 Tax=Gordonia zhenghanii TaxID=2911516 RepID=UPI001EF058DB|nr:helix-turn-helix transcriptional regulator [Gordonia zhenghanii]MCF8571766.1 helix-turn-helix transcriptional regulator [Gordonia zhenghanii]MCF8604909.1 helix-turn-helix transcriptional regulator [Gordonia zhenghanii]